MNNEEAFKFYMSNSDKGYSDIAREFITKFDIDESNWDNLRREFSKIKEKRSVYLKKNDLTTWNELLFFSIPINQQCSPLQQCSTLNFEQDLTKKPRKEIGNLTSKGLRARLSTLMSHLEAVADQEYVSPKIISNYLVMLYSQKEQDVSTAKFSKQIINHGSFGKVCNNLTIDKSAFLLDSLEIGKGKYIDLRRVLLSDGFNLPGYNRVAAHRAQLSLVEYMHFVNRDHPIGIGISYSKLLTHTINRILMNASFDNYEQPIKVRISDGLDGSGCHRVYQQVSSHPDFTTKNFILFAFKVLTIVDNSGKLMWENHSPNSPFSIRPITILSLPENHENVKFLMDTLINKETTDIKENGLKLFNGNCARVDIVRSQLDGKMAKILSGAGGACCQFCTSTFKQIHDLTLVKEGFPINRFIRDSKVLFEEVNEEEFLSLNSDQRLNITHPPLSDIEIIPGSPLHSYLRCFSWFMSLISHLNAGIKKWSPTSRKILDSKRFITSLINDKMNLMIDNVSVQGGTTTTGNVVRRCFVRKVNNENDFLYWVLTVIPYENKHIITDIHTFLGAILRVYNSDRRIDTDQLTIVCNDLYQMILTEFPWANITPTLHKILAHAPDIIIDYNNGLGLEKISEEGLESSNKLIRRYRERLSRKISFQENLQDVFNRMICQSDPILLLNRKVKKEFNNASSICNISKQEEIVISLIIDDE